MAARAYRWTVPLVAAAAGLLFVTSAGTAGGTDLRGGAYGDTAELVRSSAARADALAARAAALQAEVDALTAAVAGGAGGAGGGTDPAVAAERALAAAAGTTALRGPGVVVVLDDAEVPAVLPDGATVDDYLVHQQDVEGVLNALWSGGASGVAVMDQRVVATSAVRCVGPVLLLQGRTYPPPYRLAAVGDPDRLRAALDASPAVSTYREWAAALGLDLGVTDAATVDLPAYAGPLDLPLATIAAAAALPGS